MITAGVDAGNKWAKVVILKDGKIAAAGRVLAGFEQKKAAEQALEHAVNEAGVTKADIQYIMATGAGKEDINFANGFMTEVSAGARGAVFLYPGARTVTDVGAEEGRALKVDADGKVIDFAVNDKCAAGAGSFIETMARVLNLSIEEIGTLSLKSTRAVPLNAQCVVFAESEVVSLIHAKTSKEDIARAVNESIASRIKSMVRRVGLQPQLVLIGGVAKNPGFVKAIQDGLETEAVIPEYPEFVTALGAAVAAVDKVNG